MQAPRSFRLAYAVLLLLRLAAVFLPGYVHADEFFQSPEELAGAVLRVEIDRSWEFDPAGTPSRSIAMPAIISGLPFAVLRLLVAPEHWTARMLLCTPRLVCFLLSLVLDASLLAICRRHGIAPRGPMIWLASSFVMIVLQTRAFSNAIEGVLLAIFLAIASDPAAGQGRLRSVCAAGVLGMLGALGLFTRITFPAFGLPVGLMFVWNATAYRTTAPSTSPIVTKLRQCLVMSELVIAAATCAAVTALFLAMVDSVYFGRLQVDLSRLSTSVVAILSTTPDSWKLAHTYWPFRGRMLWTPWNNLMYNVQVENLRQHTLHPRWLHVLINLPAMYGPILVVLWDALRRTREASGGWKNLFIGNQLERSTGPSDGQRQPRAAWWSPQAMAAASSVAGLAVLSLVPHQEPRFLTALLLPLVVVAANPLATEGSRRWRLWVVLNLIAGIGYGVVHQGGTIPSLLYVDEALRSPAEAPAASPFRACDVIGLEHAHGRPHCALHLIYAHTYMPPHHLLPRNQTTHAPFARPDLAVYVHDIGGRGISHVLGIVHEACTILAPQHLAGNGSYGRTEAVEAAVDDDIRIVLVTGGSFDVGALDRHIHVGLPMAGFGLHLSTEHLSSYVRQPWRWRTWSVQLHPLQHACAGLGPLPNEW